MKKNKITFFAMELILLVLALFFVWKIFIQNVPEKRVAVILPESGDQRWDSLIKGMKQSAKENHIHLVICNTDDIENAEAEKEAIEEQKNNHIDAFIVLPAPGTDTKEMLTKECSDVPVILAVEDLYTEDAEATSKFSVVAPDYYEMGKYIGGQINSRKQTIGIVVGRKDTEAAASAVRGLTDALEGSDCQILWHYYQEKDQDVCEKVKEQPKVDTLVVLDPGALDQLGDQFEETQEETQEEAQEETQEQGAGTIVNVASMASTAAGRGGLAYTSAKHGLLGLTRQMSLDHGRTGVRINAVLPGPIATEMIARVLAIPQHPVTMKMGMSPAKRPGEPIEVAQAIAFLASDDASFIHGAALAVDGGYTIF